MHDSAVDGQEEHQVGPVTPNDQGAQRRDSSNDNRSSWESSTRYLASDEAPAPPKAVPARCSPQWAGLKLI